MKTEPLGGFNRTSGDMEPSEPFLIHFLVIFFYFSIEHYEGFFFFPPEVKILQLKFHFLLNL